MWGTRTSTSYIVLATDSVWRSVLLQLSCCGGQDTRCASSSWPCGLSCHHSCEGTCEICKSPVWKYKQLYLDSNPSCQNEKSGHHFFRESCTPTCQIFTSSVSSKLKLCGQITSLPALVVLPTGTVPPARSSEFARVWSRYVYSS